jgi:hypothetical protein
MERLVCFTNIIRNLLIYDDSNNIKIKQEMQYVGLLKKNLSGRPETMIRSRADFTTTDNQLCSISKYRNIKYVRPAFIRMFFI